MSTTTRTKRPAVWVDCPGMQDGAYAHSMRDGCWSCAPFWEKFPVCPDDDTRLRRSQPKAWDKAPDGYCRTCRKHFSLEGER